MAMSVGLHPVRHEECVSELDEEKSRSRAQGMSCRHMCSSSLFLRLQEKIMLVYMGELPLEGWIHEPFLSRKRREVTWPSGR